MAAYARFAAWRGPSTAARAISPCLSASRGPPPHFPDGESAAFVTPTLPSKIESPSAQQSEADAAVVAPRLPSSLLDVDEWGD